MDAPIVKGRVEPVNEVQLDTPSADRTLGEHHSTGNDELYATYELDHNAPFLAEVFDIAEIWSDPSLRYKQEIGEINDYLMQEIKAKTLENSTSAVKKRLTAMEKQAGIDATTPKELKVKLLAEHAKYLAKLDNIKLAVRFA